MYIISGKVNASFQITVQTIKVYFTYKINIGIVVSVIESNIPTTVSSTVKEFYIFKDVYRWYNLKYSIIRNIYELYIWICYSFYCIDDILEWKRFYSFFIPVIKEGVLLSFYNCYIDLDNQIDKIIASYLPFTE